MKKVFLFSECDYIAANTKEEAIELYENKGGLDGSELKEAIENVEEIDEQKMKNTIINIDVEDEDTGQTEWVPIPLFDILQEADPEGAKFEGAFWLVSIEP